MAQVLQQGVTASFKVVGVNKFGNDVPAPTPVAVDAGAAVTTVVTGDAFTAETDVLDAGNFNVTAGTLSDVEPFTVTPDVTATSIKVVAA